MQGINIRWGNITGCRCGRITINVLEGQEPVLLGHKDLRATQCNYSVFLQSVTVKGKRPDVINSFVALICLKFSKPLSK